MPIVGMSRKPVRTVPAIAPNVFTAYTCPTSSPTRRMLRAATAAAHGNVAPMSSVGSKRQLALTASCATWTKVGESDHRSVNKKRLGMRSKIKRMPNDEIPIPAWSAAKTAGEEARDPHSQEYSALPPAIPARKATSMALKAKVELPITRVSARVQATS